MSGLKDKYINPLTDFGFKKLFGTEPNKILLIDFLNQILPKKHQIKDLTYSKSEQLGLNELDRKAIFDLYCQDKIFQRLFEAAEIAKFSPEEREAYEESLKYYRDLKNVVDTSREEGILEGIEKRNIEIAKKMKEKGMSNAEIAERNYKGFGGNIRTLMKRMFQRGFLRILSAKICAFKEICVVRVPFFEVRQIVNNSVAELTGLNEDGD